MPPITCGAFEFSVAVTERRADLEAPVCALAVRVGWAGDMVDRTGDSRSVRIARVGLQEEDAQFAVVQDRSHVVTGFSGPRAEWESTTFHGVLFELEVVEVAVVIARLNGPTARAACVSGLVHMEVAPLGATVANPASMGGFFGQRAVVAAAVDVPRVTRGRIVVGDHADDVASIAVCP